MDFWSDAFLREHAHSLLAFYEPEVIDPTGGFHQNFYDDGSVFNPGFRQLVSSARMVFNYATAAREFASDHYRRHALHGLKYLEQVHWLADEQLYAWTLQDHQPLDRTQQAYGYAFVLLAYAACLRAGLLTDAGPVRRMFDLLEDRFWLPEHGLYADELSPGGVLSDYRGQNANMHLCEALLAAFDATGEAVYRDRAGVLAHNIAGRQAELTDNLIWEHYRPDFSIDWDYNRDDPKNLYRPWGFQPGHQTEWAKLLLQYHAIAPDPWLVTRARELFDWAWDTAWDYDHGGLVYGVAPDGTWCDTDKYFWVQAESLVAAARLFRVTGDAHYHAVYDRLWDYCWQVFVDHQYGAWFRVLDRDNRRQSDRKSEAGAKCDYHTLGACLEIAGLIHETED